MPEQVKILIQDVEKLITEKNDFQAFLLISIGIEVLGSMFDSYDFSDTGHSETRFKNGISKLFKKDWYLHNTEFIYENLRCALLHQYRTGNEILLTSTCKNSAPKAEHLQVKSGKRMFVLECFFDDFKNAADKLEKIISGQNSLRKDKSTETYQSIYTTKSNQGDEYDASGKTHSTKVVKQIKENKNSNK